MTQLLRKSTAFTFQLGPFVDDGDGKSAEPSLTIAYTACYISKDGGSMTAKADTTNLTGTGDALGYYDCVLGTGDTDTLGPLRVHVHVAGALPVWQDFMVVPANVYDSLVDGVEWLEVTGLRADFSISGATLSVKEQNGTTEQFTKTITSSAGAAPIIGLD